MMQKHRRGPETNQFLPVRFSVTTAIPRFAGVPFGLKRNLNAKGHACFACRSGILRRIECGPIVRRRVLAGYVEPPPQNPAVPTPNRRPELRRERLRASSHVVVRNLPIPSDAPVLTG